MSNKVFVANIAYTVSEDDLSDLFSVCGNVESVKIVTDRDTGKSRGFGFIEFAGTEDMQRAIDEMHDRELQGRKLAVSEARPPKRDGGGRGGRGGGGGRGGFGGGGRGRGGGGNRGGGGYRGGGGGDRGGGGNRY